MEEKLARLNKIIETMLGQKAWGVSLGIGSFLTFEFGNPVPSEKKVHGEFHVWIQNCSWRIQQLGKVLACSEDERSRIIDSVKCLENLSLLKIELIRDGFDTVFKFDNDVILYLFTIYSEEYENWMLYTPQAVYIIGPGNNLDIEARSLS